ncbi:MAG: T9SS type A sorting domain-containing protein [Candidatus Latescibacteria bacterium]|nr:T9SS type A sorting domain-containing protein [bacterium]MBD3425063.1 T9SS type A sorting domain-containing protein [Candidatus Latescibacterota bacterium]
MIASPCDTLYFDGEWEWDKGYSYKLSAVDIHGNESVFALLGPDDITGDDTPSPPRKSYLAQNYPNPFNPGTVIEFGLSESSRASLSVYDPSGRLVTVLFSGEKGAGSYRIKWDGMDRRGTQVPSGVYFYRLEAGGLRLNRKMKMIR